MIGRLAYFFYYYFLFLCLFFHCVMALIHIFSTTLRLAASREKCGKRRRNSQPTLPQRDAQSSHFSLTAHSIMVASVVRLWNPHCLDVCKSTSFLLQLSRHIASVRLPKLHNQPIAELLRVLQYSKNLSCTRILTRKLLSKVSEIKYAQKETILQSAHFHVHSILFGGRNHSLRKELHESNIPVCGRHALTLP